MLACNLPRADSVTPLLVQVIRHIIITDTERIKISVAERLRPAVVLDIKIVLLQHGLNDHVVYVEPLIPHGSGVPCTLYRVYDRASLRRLGHQGGQLELILDQIILPVLQHAVCRVMVNAVQKLHNTDAIPVHTHGVIQQVGERRQYTAPAKHVPEQGIRPHGIVDQSEPVLRGVALVDPAHCYKHFTKEQAHLLPLNCVLAAPLYGAGSDYFAVDSGYEPVAITNQSDPVPVVSS